MNLQRFLKLILYSCVNQFQWDLSYVFICTHKSLKYETLDMGGIYIYIMKLKIAFMLF